MAPHPTAGPATAGDPEQSDDRLRILVLSDVLPWPARDGYRLRLQAVLSALSTIADIDLFVGSYPDDDETVPAPGSVSRWQAVTVPRRGLSVHQAWRTAGSQLPRRILWREWGAARDALAHFANPPYDLVWFSHADTYAGLGDPSLGPVVVDLDNLENFIDRRGEVRSLGEVGPARWAQGRVRALPRGVLDARDIWAWGKLQSSIAERVSTVVVCSALDQERLGAANVAVVPNGYADPRPARYEPKGRKALVLVARFTYEPNLRGAEWLASEVMPTLRREVPDAEVTLIGRHDERLDGVASTPGVNVVGEVDDVAPMLGSARAVVVPLLTGSGTRIKVLEALAYGLPLITTSVGCEGIDVAPGVDALVHDEPAEFARALARVLRDDGLCTDLSERGRSFYLRNYEDGSIADLIRGVALGATERTVAV